MNTKTLSKSCLKCGQKIIVSTKYSRKQINETKYCSRKCRDDNRRHDFKKLKEAFFAKVRIADGCHEWSASKCEKGYGMFHINGRGIRAHRAAMFFYTGEMVSDDMLVCHACDNPGCVNPKHLFIGTAKDNNDDKIKKGRSKHLRGNDCKHRKLHSSDIPKILKSRTPATRLCLEYGVSASCIRAVRQGKNWKHLK